MAATDPVSRRSPEPYLPCEAEKTTDGFHPVHSVPRLNYGLKSGTRSSVQSSILASIGLIVGEKGLLQKYKKERGIDRYVYFRGRDWEGKREGTVSAHLHGEQGYKTIIPSVEYSHYINMSILYYINFILLYVYITDRRYDNMPQMAFTQGTLHQK